VRQAARQGGIKGYDQASGNLIGTYFSMAPGRRGGGIWSSLAVGPGRHVYGTTGTGRLDDAESIVRVNGATLAREDAWKIPDSEAINDSDFGASPTLFTATLGGTPTEMVGACNKNGLFYALRSQNFSGGPVWKIQAANPTRFGMTSCLAAAVWDGQRLFVAGSPTKIGGTSFPGSVRQLDPATGAVIWARGLNGVILGTPTLNGSGVLAAGTYDADNSNSVYLLNSSNGQLLATIPTGGAQVFGQPVFADGYLLISTNKGTGLLVYRP
jgi:outer membrane protein assembly factor BamB